MAQATKIGNYTADVEAIGSDLNTDLSSLLTRVNTVTTEQLDALSVTTAKVADGAIDADKLATDAVTTTKILNDNVTQDKIADDAVGADQLASNAVVLASIAVAAKIGQVAVGTYTGTGASSNAVTCGFQPDAVIGVIENGDKVFLWLRTTEGQGTNDADKSYAHDTGAASPFAATANVVSWDSTGFTVEDTDNRWNGNTNTYHYIAIRSNA